MDSSMRTSASGMMAQQRMIDVIANNLANVNTTGFKRSRVSFEDVLYETVQGARITNANTAGSNAPSEIGRIEIARFLNPNGLIASGQNEFVESTASGSPVTGFPEDEGMGGLLQGALESSNVEIVQEMTDMIAAQRAYEINA